MRCVGKFVFKNRRSWQKHEKSGILILLLFLSSKLVQIGKGLDQKEFQFMEPLFLREKIWTEFEKVFENKK